MKKLYAVVSVLALSLIIGVTAMAQGKAAGKGDRKAACSSCEMSAATTEQIRKFKLETVDLRQEMMNKRFDLQRENLKESPDAARVTAIRAEMDTIKAKIDKVKESNNISVSASCCKEDCPLMEGDCAGCMKAGRCGQNGFNTGMNYSSSTTNCSNCNMQGDCGYMNCNNKGNCNNCPDAANCSCAKKKK